VTLPTLALGSGVGVTLWWRVEVMKGIDVFNARGRIVTLNGSMTLYTIGLAINIGPLLGEVAALSSRCTGASTLWPRAP